MNYLDTLIVKNPQNRASLQDLKQILQRDLLFVVGEASQKELQMALEQEIFEGHRDVFFGFTDEEKARITQKVTILGQYQTQVNLITRMATTVYNKKDTNMEEELM